jgi:hypothetical protein
MNTQRRSEDFYTLNGVAHPGILDSHEPFRSADRPRMFDKRTGYGVDSAYLVYRGLDLSNFSSIFHVAMRPGQDISAFLANDPEWLAFAVLLLPPPKGVGQRGVPVFDIRHPILQDVQCDRVTIVNDMAWKQTGHGIWTKEIRFSVYRPLKPVLNTPFAKTKRPVAKTADEKRLQQLGDQQADLAKEYESIK